MPSTMTTTNSRSNQSSREPAPAPPKKRYVSLADLEARRVRLQEESDALRDQYNPEADARRRHLASQVYVLQTRIGACCRLVRADQDLPATDRAASAELRARVTPGILAELDRLRDEEDDLRRRAQPNRDKPRFTEQFWKQANEVGTRYRALLLPLEIF